MSQDDKGLRPEEFGEAAEAAIADALSRPVDEHARVLAAAGLFGVCAAEDDGGLGLPLDFAVPVVQAAGRLRLRFALAEQIVLARHLPDPAQRAALVEGHRRGTIALQGRLGDGWTGHARQAAQADWLLLRTAAGDGAVLVDLAGMPCRPDPSLDPEEPNTWLDLSGATVLAQLDAHAATALWRDLDLVLAASAHGGADGALQAAVSHTGTRVQFGAPLSSRQAVRHWLARMKLFHEASGAAIARALLPDEWGRERSARSALALNLQHAAFIIEKAIHLHGGMGFTWELPLHRALREVRGLDAACGADALARQLGRDFITAQETA
ncbi:Acyl-CoA dehydrogenase, C-terminal domain protein [Cupriavidus necator]|uniref:Acyl-CoA dehydrogenase, C-terminal domain protein n=1 Tax=Cupriavidus necator TaxID=106590 RepID=A0A1K0J6V3_CUPNE|nr:Acyl-CoA dehydrogenase, C-terminal domain protein [Cupriavidus necator]